MVFFLIQHKMHNVVRKLKNMCTKFQRCQSIRSSAIQEDYVLSVHDTSFKLVKWNNKVKFCDRFKKFSRNFFYDLASIGDLTVSRTTTCSRSALADSKTMNEASGRQQLCHRQYS